MWDMWVPGADSKEEERGGSRQTLAGGAQENQVKQPILCPHQTGFWIESGFSNKLSLEG